jgi:chorismate dehydratase
MSLLRISAISYLNTVPLMWDFEHAAASAGYDICYTIPSACAHALAANQADIGIIPAAAYTTIPDLAIIPEVAIAARRAVRSILLVSRIPLENVRTVALDSSSLTSAALAKITFAKWLGGARSYSVMEPNLDQMLAACDAALVIGNPALQIDRSRYTALDLAEEWITRTGKSFVFAFWAIRRQSVAGHDPRQIAETFQKSRDHGLLPENLETIAQQWAPRLGLTLEIIRTYLVSNIHYYLDPPCLEGLQLFYRYAAEIAALPGVPALNFL